MNLPADQREDFFQAQARHRRQAGRIGALVSLAGVALALVVALLSAPLMLIAIALLFDLIHLATPMPDLFAAGARWFDAVTSDQGASSGAWIAGLLVAATPGLAMLLLAWGALTRLAERANGRALMDLLKLREPRGAELEEQQLVNVIAEMAIAAQLPAPRVWLIDAEVVNLGAFEHEGEIQIAVTRGLLDTLDRARTQALLGHLMAHIGNGDVRLGARLLRVHELCGLLMLLSQAPLDKRARAALRELWRARRGDSAQAATTVREVLLDPYKHSDLTRTNNNKPPNWRDFIVMPLFGAMMVGILIVPVAQMLLLAVPLGLIGRSRRKLADAMAVQFTRDPTALAAALSAPALNHSALAGVPASLSTCFALPTAASGMMALVSPHPSLARRVDALRRLGANVAALDVKKRDAGKLALAWLVGAPLGAIVVVLMGVVIYLGVFVALALSMLFLALPAGALHFILRAIAD